MFGFCVRRNEKQIERGIKETMGHQKSSLAAQALETLRQDIIWSRLTPGEQVTKVSLIQRYGFGDAAIRDALNRLSQERLVRVLPREGYIVAPVTLQHVQDLFEIRLILEPQICAAAAGKVNADYLRDLESKVVGRHDLDDRTALETYVRANTVVHMAFAEASGNRRLVQLMETILDEMERIMLLSYILGHRTDSTDPGHGPLIDALVANDPDLASTIMRNQLTDNRRFVLDAFIRAPGALQTVNIAAVSG